MEGYIIINTIIIIISNSSRIMFNVRGISICNKIVNKETNKTKQTKAALEPQQLEVQLI